MSNSDNVTCSRCNGTKTGPVATTTGCSCPCTCADRDCAYCAERHGADELGKLFQCGRLREGNNPGDTAFKQTWTMCRECRLNYKQRQRTNEAKRSKQALPTSSAARPPPPAPPPTLNKANKAKRSKQALPTSSAARPAPPAPPPTLAITPVSRLSCILFHAHTIRFVDTLRADSTKNERGH